MTTDPSGLPQTPDQVTVFMDGLTYTDKHVPEHDLPPVLADGEDVLVPRSFKLPTQLDTALARLATARGISKSELVRQYLDAAVAADLTAGPSSEVLIPLADALRALTGLRQLLRSA